MAKVEKFYDEGTEQGDNVFSPFFAKHAHLFESDCDALASENKLEYTQIHKEFCELFETHIDTIFKDCPYTVAQFFTALKEEQEKGIEDASFYVQLLLSVTDY